MIKKKIGNYLWGKKLIRKIMENPVDLNEFREKPTPRLITGLVLMALSFVMGWPAIFALSFLAVWLREPLVAVIGCPAAYVLSCIVFIIGAWMSRAPHYMNTLATYSLQHFLKKVL